VNSQLLAYATVSGLDLAPYLAMVMTIITGCGKAGKHGKIATKKRHSAQ
jgi:hypothetical protein